MSARKCRVTMRAACATGSALGLALSLVAAPARPAEWMGDAARSSIAFEYSRGGTPAQGVFRQFYATGKFDPAHPERSMFELRVRSQSIDLGSRLDDIFATSSLWFDSRSHPEIVYRLLALALLDAGRYRATGTISIRGVTRPIESEVSLWTDAGGIRVRGALTLDREAFGLGAGPMSAFVAIGPEVVVRLDILAEPVAGSMPPPSAGTILRVSAASVIHQE